MENNKPKHDIYLEKAYECRKRISELQNELAELKKREKEYIIQAQLILQG